MHKKHVKPEFQVICQNEANAKFFVASGDPVGTTDTQASDSYGDGEDVW